MSSDFFNVFFQLLFRCRRGRFLSISLSFFFMVEEVIGLVLKKCRNRLTISSPSGGYRLWHVNAKYPSATRSQPAPFAFYVQVPFPVSLLSAFLFRIRRLNAFICFSAAIRPPLSVDQCSYIFLKVTQTLNLLWLDKNTRELYFSKFEKMDHQQSAMTIVLGGLLFFFFFKSQF